MERTVSLGDRLYPWYVCNDCGVEAAIKNRIDLRTNTKIPFKKINICKICGHFRQLFKVESFGTPTFELKDKLFIDANCKKKEALALSGLEASKELFEKFFLINTIKYPYNRHYHNSLKLKHLGKNKINFFVAVNFLISDEFLKSSILSIWDSNLKYVHNKYQSKIECQEDCDIIGIGTLLELVEDKQFMFNQSLIIFDINGYLDKKIANTIN